jgi:hypothetical protein
LAGLISYTHQPKKPTLRVSDEQRRQLTALALSSTR